MTPTPAVPTPATPGATAAPYDALLRGLRPLLHAEVTAEAHALGCEPADLEQTVWLRLFERLAGHGPAPEDWPGWLRRTVRAEARRSRRTLRRERPYADQHTADPGAGPEQRHLDAEHARAVRGAARALPVRCRRLVHALLSPRDLTYREIAAELGMSQGSVGPERSRCLDCLRRVLAAPNARSRNRPTGFTDSPEWGKLRQTPRASK